MFNPIVLKDQRKGLRVAQFWHGPQPERNPFFAYIALGDTPTAVGSEDVDLILIDGTWVGLVESYSLEFKKWGLSKEGMIQNAERIMQDPKRLAWRLSIPAASNMWNTLIAEGLIKTNAESQSVAVSEDGSAELSSASRVENSDGFQPLEQTGTTAGCRRYLWLYALIPLLLCAILVVVYKRR